VDVAPVLLGSLLAVLPRGTVLALAVVEITG
jgi:hypothetical protein